MRIREVDFGRELRVALAQRGAWLVDQQLADCEAGLIRVHSGALQLLARCELCGVAARMSQELAKPFAEAQVGERMEGMIVCRVDLAAGHYAFIERSRNFMIVPGGLS